MNGNFLLERKEGSKERERESVGLNFGKQNNNNKKLKGDHATTEFENYELPIHRKYRINSIGHQICMHACILFILPHFFALCRRFSIILALNAFVELLKKILGSKRTFVELEFCGDAAQFHR